jgi:hypothetical protein
VGAVKKLAGLRKKWLKALNQLITGIIIPSYISIRVHKVIKWIIFDKDSVDHLMYSQQTVHEIEYVLY